MTTAMQNGTHCIGPLPEVKNKYTVEEVLAALDSLTPEELLQVIAVLNAVYSNKSFQAVFQPIVEPLVQAQLTAVLNGQIVTEFVTLINDILGLAAQAIEMHGKLKEDTNQSLTVSVKAMQLAENAKRVAVFCRRRAEPFIRPKKNRDKLFAAFEQAKEDQPTWNAETLYEKLKADFPEQMAGLTNAKSFESRYRSWRRNCQRAKTKANGQVRPP
jgi:hypothetical protein